MLQTKQLRLLFHSSSFSSLSFFRRHQASPFFSSFTLFSSQSHCFSLFLSDITLTLFIFHSDLYHYGFFFFFDTRFGSGWVEMVIGRSLVVVCDGQIQWWVAAVVCVCMCVCFFFFPGGLWLQQFFWLWFIYLWGGAGGCGIVLVVVVDVVAAEVVVSLLLMMMMMGK